MPNSRRSRSSDAHRRTRQQVAVLAARLMAEGGVRDFEDAKRRAAESLGLDADAGHLPGNAEIDAELRTYQRLFQGISQPQALALRRQAAIPAMEFFGDYEARLVGPVLDGTADEHSAVCLHLFADDPRSIEWFLEDRRIPFEAFERTMRDADGDPFEAPAYRFARDGLEFDLTVFPVDAIRQAPLDRVTKKPMKRADRAAVIRLVAATGTGTTASRDRES